MAVIALANLKGGVGKSTLAVNIAGALVPKSALLDADPQATATAWAEAGKLPFPVIESALKRQRDNQGSPRSAQSRDRGRAKEP